MASKLLVPRPLPLGDGDRRTFKHAYRKPSQKPVRLDGVVKPVRDGVPKEQVCPKHVRVRKPMLQAVEVRAQLARLAQNLVVDIKGGVKRGGKGGRIKVCRKAKLVGVVTKPVAPKRRRRERLLRVAKRAEVKFAVAEVVAKGG